MNKLNINEVEELLHGRTYKEVSEVLKARYPGERGFSVISVKRFCYKHGLSTTISQENLDNAVAEAISEVRNTLLRVNTIWPVSTQFYSYFI